MLISAGVARFWCKATYGGIALVHHGRHVCSRSAGAAALRHRQRLGRAPRSAHTMKKPYALNFFVRPLLVMALAAATLVTTNARAQMPEITLTIAGQKLTAEVAATNPERMQGLMHRRMMPENRGMVFVFTEVANHAMWMENTFIPLSVAFIDSNGIITNIEDMKPHTRDAHPAVKPVRYALEMNLGWFAKRGIKAGAKIEGLEKAPVPK